MGMSVVQLRGPRLHAGLRETVGGRHSVHVARRLFRTTWCDRCSLTGMLEQPPKPDVPQPPDVIRHPPPVNTPVPPGGPRPDDAPDVHPVPPPTDPAPPEI